MSPIIFSRIGHRFNFRAAVAESLPSFERLAIYAGAIAAFAMIVCILLGIAR